MLLDGELVDAPEDVRGLRVDEGDGVSHGSSSGPRQSSCAVKKCDPSVVRRDISDDRKCNAGLRRVHLMMTRAEDSRRFRGRFDEIDGLHFLTTGNADSSFYG